MYKHTQRSFAGGRLDRELMGRQDLAKYFTGASELKNLLVRRQGNLAKRRGTDESADLANLLGYVPGSPDASIPLRAPRLFPLVSTREQGYHLLVANRRAYLCSRKGVRSVSYGWLREIAHYDGTVDYAGRASVASDYPYMIGPDGYDTLQEASAAAQDGDTIKVYTDDTFSETVSFATSGTVTLDLNGHTLSFTATSVVSGTGLLRMAATGNEENPPTLVITDTAGGGAIVQPTSATVDLLSVSSAHTRIRLENGRVIARAKNISGGQARAAAFCCADGIFEMEGGVLANETLADDPADTTSRATIVRATSGGASFKFSGGLCRGAVPGDPSAEGAVMPWERVDLAVKDATISWDNFVGLRIVQGGCICAEAIASLRMANGTHTPHGARGYDADGDWPFGVVGYELSGAHWPALVGIDSSLAKSNFRVAYAWAWDPDGLDEGFAANDGEGWNLAFDAEDSENVMGQWRIFRTTVDREWVGSNNLDASLDDDHWATPAPESGGGQAARDLRPYYVNVPWDDAELAELNFCQSGDTLFFAHRSHPPARIVFDPASVTLEYSLVPFAAPWLPPVLSELNKDNINKTTSAVSSGATKSARTETTTAYTVSGGTGTKTVTVKRLSENDEVSSTTSHPPVRSVAYCVSYVKDGVESPPSAPRSTSYVAPWQEGEKITVKFNKGGNEAEPDEYRIYKKQGTEFGLIGTVRNDATIETHPSIALAAGSGSVARGSFSAWPGDGAARVRTPFTAPEAEEARARAVSGVCETWSARMAGALGEVTCWPGLGAVTAPQATFGFGKNSGVSVATVKVQVDAHALRYEELADGTVDVFDDITLSGKTVTCKMSRQTSAGASASSLSSTKTLSPVTYTPKGGTAQTAYDGTVTHYLGNFPADLGHAALVAAAASAGLKPRVATFSFAVGTDQTRNVVVTATGADGQACDLVLAAIAFTPKSAIAHSFDDDYITPDMSLTPVSVEYPFQGTGNYPGCVGIHQQRLVFASTRNDPASIRFSATGDLYTFSPHSSLREDDTISFSLAATEFPDVNHLVVTRDVLLLCDGGEWKVAPTSGNTLTFKTVSATLQGRVGSSRRIRPMAIGDEVVFADASEMALLATRYNYASDGYESTNLTVLSSNLFNANRIVQAAYEQFPDSRLKAVLADGRVAVMVYMPEHEVMAWSQCVLGGGARARGVSCSKAIVGNTSDTAYLVERGGAWFLWSVRPDLPDLTVAAQACMDGVRVLSGAEAAAEWQAGWVAVDALTAEVCTSADQTVDGRSYLCGFPFEAELVTVRPEVQSQGTIQFEIKNAKDAEVRVLDSASWRAAPDGYADDPVYAQRVDAAPAAEDGAIALDSSDHTLLLSGHNTGDGRVQLKSDDPWPLNILSLSVNYEIQPLSNSEG